MSKLVPSTTRGRVAAVCSLLFAGALLTMALVDQAQAAPYANPFWANNSPSPESPLCDVASLGLVTECVSGKCRVLSGTCPNTAVDVRTGELHLKIALFRTPGVVEDNVYTIKWRSMVSGSSQFGNGMLPGWETTAQYVVLLPGTPNAPNGHRVDIRRPCGRVDAFMWNGTAYVAPGGVFDTLITTAQSNYQLTDKWGNAMTFDNQGMPNTVDDRNLNRDTFVYNASYQLQTHTDDRTKSYTTAFNANGYMSSIQDPCGRTWTFTYDASANLKTIKTPTTPDQPSGITTTLNYDASNRLTSVTDGRGNTVWQYAYVGATNQVASVTIDGNTVSYTYGAGMTTRTDRNGNVYRYYYTGNQITKTDMLIAGQAKYVTLYRYSGVFLANVVYPRGNRVDFTFDTMGNLTNRRHRTQDTSTNDPSDLVYVWAYSAGNLLTGYTDPRGNAWAYARDLSGNLTSVTHPTVTNPATQSASESFVYNTKGQRTDYTDEEGNLTKYHYFTTGSSSDLLQKVEVDPNGLDLETTYTYDSCGNVTTVTDARGHATTYSWDNLRRLITMEGPSPLGYEVKYEYDANHNRTKEEIENVDKDGNVVMANPWFANTFTYTNTDDLKTVTEEIDASTVRTTTLDYDANQNRIRVTKPEGNKEKWSYNERDRITQHVRGEGATEEVSVQYAYDENGNQVRFTDGRNSDTTFAFDLFDRLTRMTNALGHYTEWTLDGNGNATDVARKDSLGAELQRESHFYDERNRLWKVSALFKDPSQTYPDAVTTFERWKTGQIKNTTDPRGKVTTQVFDAAQRLTTVTDAMGNEWSHTLDRNGNRVAWSFKEIDGAGSVTHNYEATYDEINRRKTYVEIDRADVNNQLVTEYEYDSRSNLVFRVDAEGNPVRWTFDGLSRMTKRERALTLGATIDEFTAARVTEWGFDMNDRLTSHKDDGANESTFDYDAVGRRITLTYPDTKTCSYEYDEADNITKVTDPAGNVVEDTFDVLNRNTSRTVTLATGFLGTTSETRQYDALNRITLNRDNDYQLEYEYAVIGLRSLVAEETQSYWGAPNAYPKTVTKTYDAAGNRASEVYPSGANLSLNYTYNDINRLTDISDGATSIAAYGWIGLRKNTTTYQSGATRTNHFTGFRNEVESVRHETSAQTTIVRLDYGYNKVHDRTYERFGGLGSSGDAFAYDKLRRIDHTWMGSSNPSSPVGNSYVKKIDYNMDDDGNRSSVVTTPYQQSPTTTDYTTNNLNEYTAVGVTAYTWDANGSLVDNGTYTFEYNYKNLIEKVRLKSDNSVVATYRYDAEGRRVEKSVDGSVQRFVRSRVRPEYQRDSLAAAGRYPMSHVITVFDGSNSWSQTFVWGNDIDEIEALEQADVLDYDSDGNTTETTRSFYHRNAVGSVMEVSNLSQGSVVSYRYDAFGSVTITRNEQQHEIDPLGNGWMFSGRMLDEETGLLYCRARYYDAGVGRFIQRDPLGYTSGPNLFVYAGNSPSSRRDPSGLEDEPSNSAGSGSNSSDSDSSSGGSNSSGSDSSGSASGSGGNDPDSGSGGTGTNNADSSGSEDSSGSGSDGGELGANLAEGNGPTEIYWGGVASIDAKLATRRNEAAGRLKEKGRKNAFLHCYWICQTCKNLKNAYKAPIYGMGEMRAQQAAVAAARAVGVAHENAVPGHDREKDLMNNEVGLNCCWGNASCEWCCLNSDWYSDPPPPSTPPPPPGPTSGGGGAGGCGEAPPPRPKWVKHEGRYGPGKGVPCGCGGCGR